MPEAEPAWPPVERRVNLTRGALVLRRQPPVRVVYCQVQAVRLDACNTCGSAPVGACAECVW